MPVYIMCAGKISEMDQNKEKAFQGAVRNIFADLLSDIAPCVVFVLMRYCTKSPHAVKMSMQL